MTGEAGLEFQWDERKIEWYTRALAWAQYPGVLLPLFRQLLLPEDRVLDVGTGTGALALAVAPLVKEVVGIDTSHLALAALERAARQAGLRNVRAIHAPWEEIAEPGDVVVCAYGGAGDPTSLLALESLARRAVVLVLPQNRARVEFGVHRLFARLGLPAPPRRKIVARDVRGLLATLGIRYGYQDFRARFDQPLLSPAEGADFLMAHFGLDDSHRQEVERFVAENLVRQGDVLLLPNVRLMEAIWWPSSG